MTARPNYMRMYFRMFNDISTAIEQLESGDPWKARITLIGRGLLRSRALPAPRPLEPEDLSHIPQALSPASCGQTKKATSPQAGGFSMPLSSSVLRRDLLGQLV